MILCDTGVIVASINSRDNDHVRCIKLLRGIQPPLITTSAYITETMYLVGERGGYPLQNLFGMQMEAGIYKVVVETQADVIRACVLMRKYRDVPMDYADATLVVAAETLGIAQILTIDKHFYAYQINDQSHFVIILL